MTLRQFAVFSCGILNGDKEQTTGIYVILIKQITLYIGRFGHKMCKFGALIVISYNNRLNLCTININNTKVMSGNLKPPLFMSCLYFTHKLHAR